MKIIRLNEENEYVTYLNPILEAIGKESIESLNWIIDELETSLSGTSDVQMMAGDTFLLNVQRRSNEQIIWGLYRGYAKDIPGSVLKGIKRIDLETDIGYWLSKEYTNSQKSEIEIYAFDSSETFVRVRDEGILDRLKSVFNRLEIIKE